ncbi:MAG: class I adenylate-forming enzyme family protein [Acidimicrobiia bacterium]
MPELGFRPTLPVLLRRAVELYGDGDYVVMRDRRISFRQAERATAALARKLLAAGVGKGTRIGIILPTGIDWMVAWLAAARIGAMPMAFPATYRPAELQRALRISDVAVLFAQRTLLGKDYEALLEESVPSLGAHVDQGPLHDMTVPFLRSVWMVGGSDRPWATPVDLVDADHPAEPTVSEEFLAAIEAEVSPADPIVVIYTSGSSADPKAVVHTHGSTIRKMPQELGICLGGSKGGREFCAMPFFWIGGPQELLGALYSGAAIVTQERFDVEGALDLIERERCETIGGWATLQQELRSHPTFATRDLALVTPTLPAGMRPASSKGDPPNLGMTETFGPHANREYFDYKVIDPETGESLPDGEIGEFCVRGFGLMAGMYKREREEVFDVDGYYHTGDRGYIEDGRIWFKGRFSEMIKSGGANVAPLEIETVLLSFPEVKAAYVFGLPDAERGEIVAAAVVPADGTPVDSLDTDDLRRRINHELSAYKVPARWIVVAEADVPTLSNGKPDKRALRDRFV